MRFFPADKFDKLVTFLRNVHEDNKVGYGIIPYLMIQPCMYNRKEYKVVCLENKALDLSAISGAGSRKALYIYTHINQFNIMCTCILYV